MAHFLGLRHSYKKIENLTKITGTTSLVDLLQDRF